MNLFTLKQGDTLPALRLTLKNAEGVPLSLVGASVVFRMRGLNSTALLIQEAPTVINAAGGVIEYAWKAGQTNTVGVFYVEVELTYIDGRQTVPTNGFIELHIVPRLS